MRVEADRHHFRLMSNEGMQALPGFGVPNLGGLIEGPSGDAIAASSKVVPVRNIEDHAVHAVLVPFESV